MANARMIYCNRATTRDCAKKGGEKEQKHDRARGGRRHESINSPYYSETLFADALTGARVLTVVQFRCRDNAGDRRGVDMKWRCRVEINEKKSGQKCHDVD